MRNRLVVAPMTTYSSHEDGRIRDSELDYLRRRSVGFAMVMTAACYVHKSGHAFQGQWRCDADDAIPFLAATARAIKDEGAAAVLQIHHGGRQCRAALTGETPWSASAIAAERPNAETPRAMTEDEIETAIAAFANAAQRAEQAGFDGVEIHGANTYLIQQFVSPHSNRREDAWGRDRLKFSLALTEAVLQKVSPRFAVGYRFSPEEPETPGIRWSDTERLIDALCEHRLDWLHVSLRDYRQASIVGDYDEPTLLRVARTINGRTPLIGVGSIKTAEDAEAALAMGADLVALGRVAISEPEWPQRVAAGEPVRTTVPARNARDLLTLPEGLESRIYEVKGWFDVEDD